MDDVDNGRVGQIDADGVTGDDPGIVLLVRDQLEKQADIVLVPLQHFLGFRTGAVRGEAHHTGLDRQIAAIIVRLIGNHHGDGTQPIAGFRTQTPKKRNIASEFDHCLLLKRIDTRLQ